MPILRHKAQKTLKVNSPKTALVTGANKGIGFATVKTLARQGYRVWLGSRDAALGNAAVQKLRTEGLDVRLLLIDVTGDTSVQQAAAMLAAETPHLNLLINNAGISLDLVSPPSIESLESVRQTYEVNVFGPIRVTQSFLPLLKAAPQARIIMVSSIIGSITLSQDKSTVYGQVNYMGYSSSKSALNAVIVAFAKELEALEIKVYAIEPGHIKTDLNGNTGTLSPDEGAAVSVKYATTTDDLPTGSFFGPQGILPW